MRVPRNHSKASAPIHRAKARCFADSQEGAVALIFGLAPIPISMAVGSAIDLGYAMTMKARLHRLADQAALAAVKAAAQKEADCIANPAGNNYDNYQGSGCGFEDISRVGANAGKQYLASDPAIANDPTPPTISLTSNNGSWTATVTYSASIRTSMSRLMGMEAISVGGKTTSNVSLGKSVYVNVHLLLDHSMSMGIGATSDDIARMQTLTGCAFGCHSEGYESQYYDQPKAQGVRFRIDDLRDATTALVAQAKLAVGSESRNRVKMGVYAFNHTVTPLVSMTADLSAVGKAVQALDLPTKDDGTQAGDALSWLNSQQVKSGGTGLAETTPQEVVFLVTDGVEDGIYTGWTGMVGPKGKPLPWWPKYMTYANTGAFPPGACDALKTKGAIVAVVYTTYVPFPGTVQYDNLIGPFATNISPNLESCATQGYFFVASNPGDITRGMQQLFNKALSATALRLTQ